VVCELFAKHARGMHEDFALKCEVWACAVDTPPMMALENFFE